MNRINNNNTKPQIQAKSIPVKPVRDYEMVYQLRQIPVSDAYLEDLGLDLMEWADKNKEALKVNVWLRSKLIARNVFRDWCKRSEKLAMAHSFAKNAIGDRREIAALNKQMDASLVLKTMPIYDEDWVELTEWTSKLRDDQAQAASNFKIIMPAIEKPKE